MRKMRLREVKCLAKGHTASQEFEPRQALKATCFTTVTREEHDTWGNSPGQTAHRLGVQQYGGVGRRQRWSVAELKEVKLVLGRKRWEGSA